MGATGKIGGAQEPTHTCVCVYMQQTHAHIHTRIDDLSNGSHAFVFAETLVCRMSVKELVY